MSKVFIFLEAQDGKLKKGGIELLSWAKNNSLEINAGLVGSSLGDAAKLAGNYGAKTVFTSESASDGMNPLALINVLKEMIQSSGAKIVLANGSMLAKDVFPRLAAELNSGIASDCIQLKLEGEKVIATKPLYAGKCTADVEFLDDSLSIVLMRSNQLPVNSPDESATAEIKTVSMAEAPTSIQLEKKIQGESNKPDLTEANIIISGGRGLGEAKNFQVLEELASTLGATVGASRAVVDAGWVPHGMQVGQTGKTVSPSLYIA